MIALLLVFGLSGSGSDSAVDSRRDSVASARSFSPELGTWHGWVALGAFPYYGYDPGVEGGWAGRVDLSARKGRWLGEADVQVLTDSDQSTIGSSVIVQAGWLPFRLRNVPDIWITTGLWSSSRIQGEVAGNRDRIGPTAGFQTILPLVGMDHGEVRFSMAYSPLEGALYKAMDVGWDVGPVGLRAGGTGLRTGYGRLYSAFTFEVCKRW